MIGQERNGWPFRIAALRPIQMSPPQQPHAFLERRWAVSLLPPFPPLL